MSYSYFFPARLILCTPSPSILTFVLDDDRNEPIINVDLLVDANHIDNILVVHPQHVLCARFLVLVVRRDRDHLASFKFELGVDAL